MKTTTLFTLLIALLSFTSCDECKDLSCGAYDCVDGACDCPEPFEGENCATHKYRELEGNFVGTMTHYEDGALTDTQTDLIMYVNFGGSQGDEVMGFALDWVSEGSFNLIDSEGNQVGSGTVSLDSESLSANTTVTTTFPDNSVTEVRREFSGVKQ